MDSGQSSSTFRHLAPEEDTLELPSRVTPIDPAEESIEAATEHRRKVFEMLSTLHRLEDKIENIRPSLQTNDQRLAALALDQEIQTRSAELRREQQVAREIVEREKEILIHMKASHSYRLEHPKIQQRLDQLRHEKELLREARRLREQQQGGQNNGQHHQ